MRCNRGLTLVGLLVVVVIAAIAAALVLPAFSRALARAAQGREKATCLSNLRQLALACIMYCAEYDEMLPACVADDRDGTAHAVGGVYTNWKMEALRRDVRAKYGDEYVDGRWMWQLGDLLLPAAGSRKVVGAMTMAHPMWTGYVRSTEVFECPALVRRDPSFGLRTYLIGLDKENREDRHDPLLRIVANAGWLPVRKTWQSGSYVYMCMHYPQGAGVRASDYGAEWFSLWDAAKRIGIIGDGADPRDYLACGNSLAIFRDPVMEPLLMCRSFGAHEGYDADYVAGHGLPPELGGAAPTIPLSAPMAFADGHVKYVTLGFYDMLAFMLSPNQVRLGHAR